MGRRDAAGGGAARVVQENHVRRSGRVIVIHEGRVAAIQRDRAGHTYYVFPGGGVERNETPDQAAIREAHEELGISIRPQKLVAVVRWNEHEMYFYQSLMIGGTFGSGRGPEFYSYTPVRGTYRPVWLDLPSLADFDVRPKELATALATGTLFAQTTPLTLTIPTAV